MAMEDILPTLILLLAVFLIFRYFTKSSSGSSNPDVIPGVTANMVESVHSAFPDVPLPNLIYSLSRTKSSQATSEEIIERGFLSSPPTSFRIPPSLLPPTVNPPSPTTSTSSTFMNSLKSTKGQISLIERYGLTARLPSTKGKEVDPGERISVGDQDAQEPASGNANKTSDGKGKWADSKEAREVGLRERKEKMILEARRRMMEKQKMAETTN